MKVKTADASEKLDPDTCGMPGPWRANVLTQSPGVHYLRQGQLHLKQAVVNAVTEVITMREGNCSIRLAPLRSP